MSFFYHKIRLFLRKTIKIPVKIFIIIITILIFILYLSLKSENHKNEHSKNEHDKEIITRTESIEKINKLNELKHILIEQKYKNVEKNQYQQLKEFQSAKIIDPKTLDFYKRIQRRRYDVDCRAIVEWNEFEIRKAKRLLYQYRDDSSENSFDKHHIPTLPDSNFLFNKEMCSYFREIRGYDKHIITKFEYQFQLAFNILTYNNVEQFERLLRVIYRPQNVYCIHIDAKSSQEFKKSIQSITDCFPNVFISTKIEKIVYAHFSRLKADINCMSDFFNPNYTHSNLIGKNVTTNWKYLLNLASTEFPLRTNYELARILSVFNGANDIEVIQNFQKDRVLNKWVIVKKNKERDEEDSMKKTSELKSSAPHNFTIVKGIAYCSFSRKFVEYALNNQYAKNLLSWSKDTYSPDEWYWATLQFNTQFNPPGGFQDMTRSVIPTRSRFIGWNNKYKCMGALRHNVCMFSLEDIPNLVSRAEFFVNKFLIDYDPIAYQCMEEWILNKISLHQTINVIQYCRLPFLIPYSMNPSCIRK